MGLCTSSLNSSNFIGKQNSSVRYLVKIDPNGSNFVMAFSRLIGTFLGEFKFIITLNFLLVISTICAVLVFLQIELVCKLQTTVRKM